MIGFASSSSLSELGAPEIDVNVLRRAKRGAFLMKQGGGKRASEQRVEWVSLVVVGPSAAN